MAGDHVPEIPLFETDGRLMTPPKHTGSICVNSGLGCGITFTVIVAGLAHGCANGSGVKV